MSLQGPIVVVAETHADGLLSAIATAGAFPVVETSFQQVLSAIEQVRPVAVVLTEAIPADTEIAATLERLTADLTDVLPVVARATSEGTPPLASALTVPSDAPDERLIERIASALRLRTLHATTMRRAALLQDERGIIAELPEGDPLDDASVLVIGRGRSQPVLTVAIGERTGVMGAFSVDAAARCLEARDIEGIAIGDGLSLRHVDALLTALADDSRYRELPIGILGDPRAPAMLNVVRAREPLALSARLLPLVRLRAHEGRLKRLISSIERMGMLDPNTGLLSADAFEQDFARAVEVAAGDGSGLTLARFSFDRSLDRRRSLDAARLLGRLMRAADFASRQDDGSILAAFTATDLRAAHVVARRLAAVLRHTMLPVMPGGEPANPHVTLASLKPADTPASLLERVCPPRQATPQQVTAASA